MDNLEKNKVVSWISEHAIAWEDFLYFFALDVDENNDFTEESKRVLKDISLDEIIDWIFDHEILYDDFKKYFNIIEEEE